MGYFSGSARHAAAPSSPTPDAAATATGAWTDAGRRRPDPATGAGSAVRGRRRRTTSSLLIPPTSGTQLRGAIPAPRHPACSCQCETPSAGAAATPAATIRRANAGRQGDGGRRREHARQAGHERRIVAKIDFGAEPPCSRRTLRGWTALEVGPRLVLTARPALSAATSSPAPRRRHHAAPYPPPPAPRPPRAKALRRTSSE